MDAEASGLYEGRLAQHILKGRSVGVAAYTAKEALSGAPPAQACAPGIDFDVRKWRPLWL
ncbi:hypothetical protein [Klebsiella pneumoniae]|uniref:hypothetical protein n=1 Tax=Klebsiella pneumoniae TaxID=573 RepID=UPI000F52FA9B|nr:hypothetical protein [Klebsiella pneumoniae]